MGQSSRHKHIVEHFCTPETASGKTKILFVTILPWSYTEFPEFSKSFFQILKTSRVFQIFQVCGYPDEKQKREIYRKPNKHREKKQCHRPLQSPCSWAVRPSDQVQVHPLDLNTSIPTYRMVHKKRGTLLLPIYLPIIDQFLKIFHRHTLQTVCNNMIIIYATTL